MTHAPPSNLSSLQQTINIGIYALTNGLAYLAAPVLYVGITQATLCQQLGASTTVANLPSAAFFWAAVAPLFVAWRFRGTRVIKSVIVACYSLAALAGALVAASLYYRAPTSITLGAVVLYGAMIGGALATINAFLWDVVARGIEPHRRGVALGITFGFGPLLAVAGSLAAQWILAGELGVPNYSTDSGFTLTSIAVKPLAFPLNFAALFAASVPVMLLAAALAAFYILPADELASISTSASNSFQQGLQDIFADRVLRLSVISLILVSAGCQILGNMTLYTPEALHRPAQDFAGYQNALRFSFKVFAGFLLGWALTKTHAKAGVLLTAACCLAGVIWVLTMPSRWFLISFGLMGAGELYGVYFPNYLMNRSHPDRVRYVMAGVGLLGLVTSLAPPLYGLIAESRGLPFSFVVSAGILAIALLTVVFRLPSRPQPLSDDQITKAKP